MSTPNDKEALRTWATDLLRKMGEHLASRALIGRDQVKLEARWNYPFRVLLAEAWGANTPNERFWVIAGDVPTDHVESKLAPDARAALKHFALRWQLQGARVKSGDRDLASGTARPEGRVDWTEFGDSLALRAEFLYALVDDDRNWAATTKL